MELRFWCCVHLSYGIVMGMLSLLSLASCVSGLSWRRADRRFDTVLEGAFCNSPCSSFPQKRLTLRLFFHWLLQHCAGKWLKFRPDKMIESPSVASHILLLIKPLHLSPKCLHQGRLTILLERQANQQPLHSILNNKNNSHTCI